MSARPGDDEDEFTTPPDLRWLGWGLLITAIACIVVMAVALRGLILG